jgi:hypothetical protein
MTGLVSPSGQANALPAASTAQAPQQTREPSKEDLELAARLLGHSQGQPSPSNTGEGDSADPETLSRSSTAAEQSESVANGHPEHTASHHRTSRESSESQGGAREQQYSAHAGGSPLTGQVCR